MDSEQPVDKPRWVYVGVLTIIGFGLLWSANAQFDQIRRITGSTFEFPSGRLLIWLLTLIAAGLVIGLTAGRHVADNRPVAIAAWSIVPFLILAWFYSRFSFGLPSFNLPRSLFEFLGSQMTVVASSLILGFFLSALVADRISRRKNDQSASDGPIDQGPATIP
ncbi:MAG TPA: hypothetical protein VMM14_02010 [Acidimicrobiia bacterium]|nr:hypothetical protein [Acidimicrobiia bacterium]